MGIHPEIAREAEVRHADGGGAASRARSPRDPRLDLFRGLTMLVIFIAHVPRDSWNAWIPARFGFSSGTELFVFCSGFASALAFGRIFAKRGFALGAARIAKRIWEVYWAHIGLVVAIVALSAAVDRLSGSALLQEQFAPLTRDPAGALLGLATLTWLPDYLDILPVYLVILALVPVMIALRRLHPALPFAAMAGLHAMVWTAGINLPGNPWTGSGWFLNPFAWQLVFFTGFAFGMGWLPAPRLRAPKLVAACLAFVAVSVPLSFWGILESVPAAQAIRDIVLAGNEKGDLHPLRLLHFLAVAYLVLSAIEPWRGRLDAGPGHLLILIGRQSLATFLASLFLARIAGVALERAGGGEVATAAVNLLGFAAILAVALVAGWFKSAPWAKSSGAPAPGAHTRP